MFVQGDACELSLSALGGVPFHVILGANLLCRLPYPRRFLAALPALLEPQGFLVLPSPYTWLQQYTPKCEWIGGYVDPLTGKEVRSAEALQQIMEEKGHFKLVRAHVRSHADSSSSLTCARCVCDDGLISQRLLQRHSADVISLPWHFLCSCASDRRWRAAICHSSCARPRARTSGASAT